MAASIRELGFVRNESARQLRAGRSRTIGLVVLDVANPFFTDLARGVEDEASKAGFAVILCNSDDQERKEKRYLELLEEHRVQGVLITPVAGAGSRLARLQRRGTPVVLVDSRSASRGQCSVAVDDVLGGDLAVSHLLATGHERIAYLSGPPAIRQVADRHEGALRALRRAGRGRTDLQVVEAGGLNVAAGQKAGAEIAALPAGSRPTAVFCANDLIALGVLQEMTRNRIRVPEDVSIIGYDDIDFAAAAAVPLTSVRQPRQQLGHTAARLLLDEAADDDTHQHRQVIFEPELVVRQSSAPAAGRLRVYGRAPFAPRRGLLELARDPDKDVLPPVGGGQLDADRQAAGSPVQGEADGRLAGHVELRGIGDEADDPPALLLRPGGGEPAKLGRGSAEGRRHEQVIVAPPARHPARPRSRTTPGSPGSPPR